MNEFTERMLQATCTPLSGGKEDAIMPLPLTKNLSRTLGSFYFQVYFLYILTNSRMMNTLIIITSK